MTVPNQAINMNVQQILRNTNKIKNEHYYT